MKLFNLNTERVILSSVLFEPQIFDEISSKLEPHDFYLPFHRSLFDTMLSMNAKRKPLEELLIQQEMGANHDEIAFLDVMSANAVSNIEPYIEQLKELSRKRKLIKISKTIQMEIDEEKKSEEIISSINKDIKELDKNNESDFPNIEEMFQELEIEMKEAQRAKIVLPSGLTALDEIIGGFEKGEVNIFGARPNMGKTALVTSLMAHWIEEGHQFLFDSLEMGRTSILRRIISASTKNTISSLKDGKIYDHKGYIRCVNNIKSSHLLLHDKTGLTVDHIINKARRTLRRNPNIKGWIIDHIGEPKFGDPRFLRIEIGELIGGMKTIAKEFNIPVIALAQLNRAVTSRKDNIPTLSDLRESGEIEQKADKVILIHRESYYARGKNQVEPNTTEAQLIVAKNRDGAVGVAKVNFIANQTKFTNKRNYESEPYSVTFEDPIKEF